MTGFQLNSGSSLNGKFLQSDANGKGSWASVSGSGTVNTGQVNRLAVYATAGTAVSDQTVIYEDGTNIGIGTAGPGALLDVKGTVRILSPGNLGINSLSPGQQLDVTGTVRAVSFVTLGGTSSQFNKADGSLDSTSYCTSGGVNCPASAGSNFWLNTAAVGNVGIATITNSVGIGTTIGNGQFVVMGGNVGIGTWNPSNTLNVAGGETVSGTISAGAVQTNSSSTQMTTNGFTASAGYTTSAGFGGAPSSLTSGAVFSGSSSSNNFTGNLIVTSYTGTNSGSAANFGIANTSASGTVVKITNTGTGPSLTVSAGNVGIGTFVPGSLLSIAGGVGIGTGFNSSYVSTAAPSGGMIVQGNVGLGSLAPGVTLDVNGTSRMTGFTLTGQGAAASSVLVSNAIGVGTWMSSTTLNVVATAAPGGASPQLQYNNAGSTGGVTSGGSDGTNIGIGTVSFKNRLNIVGNVGISTLANSPYVNLGMASPEALVVEGNVGIGTWDPQFPLQIKGNVGIGTLAIQGTPAYNLLINNVASFNSEFQIASNIGVGTTNVNWNNGIYQNVGIGTNGTNSYITFTHPTNGNLAKLQLRILEDATGSRALPFWPSTVLWSGGNIPTLSGAAKSDIINCTWNGVKDYCSSTLNF